MSLSNKVYVHATLGVRLRGYERRNFERDREIYSSGLSRSL